MKRGFEDRTIRRPWWVNYTAAVLTQAGLTAFLLWLYPYFPLADFPAPYAAALLVTVLAFGVGPAVVALVLSLLAFVYFFVPPAGLAIPETKADWTAAVAYVIITSTVVAAVAIIKRGRQRAERLAVSLEETSHTVDLAHLFVKDIDDVIIFWNKGAEMLYGYTAEEAVGRISHDLLKTDFPRPLREIKRKLFETGEWQGELLHTRRDGVRMNVSSHWALHEHNGKPADTIEVNSDITGRVQAQRALERALRELSELNQDKESINEELRVSNAELQLEMGHRAQAEAEASKLAAIVESSGDAIIGKTLNGVITSWNRGAENIYGYHADEVIGRSISILVPEDRPDDTAETMSLVAGGAMLDRREVERVCKDGKRICVSLTISPVRDASGEIIGASTIARDVTEGRRAAHEREITVEFLRLVNESRGTRDLVRAAAMFFQMESGCEAVGIRLKDGDDYPYYEARGFGEEFVLAEDRLCRLDDKGCTVKDSGGSPIMECMCGNVIQGRTDPSKSFFTEHGSFWTNSTSGLMATSTETDRQSRTRDRCNGEGYESVALIPLHVGSDRLGLLQLNDKRKDMFSSEIIGLWERFGDYLATAIRKFQAEEETAGAKQDAEQRAAELSALMDAVPAAVFFCYDPKSERITGNRVARELVEVGPEANISKSAPDAERPGGWQEMRKGVPIPSEDLPIQRAVRGEFVRDYEMDLVFDDGRVKSIIGNASPLFDANGKPRGAVAVLTDISARKQAEEALMQTEIHKREFYRETIRAATEGKLIICEPAEIRHLAGEKIGEWQVKDISDLATVRVATTELARQAGLDSSRIYDFMGCVVESVGNAAKHAAGGRAALYRQDHSLLFAIADSGPGIGAMRLPDVALTRGYTTAGTLGMGYKVMISFADKVYLATGPEGTTVATEMALTGSDETAPAAI